MKTLWAFVLKEIYHILRDRRTLFILFGMPAAQVLIFGFAVTNEFKGASFAIYDQSNDPVSIALGRHMSGSGHFKQTVVAHRTEDIHQAFQSGKIKMALVIPPDFGDRYRSGNRPEVQVIADGSDPNTATTLVNYASMMIAQFKAQRVNQPFHIEVATRMVYNPELKSVFMFVPGVITLVLMLISALMTSLTLAKEKETGTMELLLVSPLHPMMIIVGKVLPYVLLSLINAVLIIAMGVYIFDVPIKGSLIALLGLNTLFIITALSLGILISTRTQTQQSAMLISLLSLMMPSMLLSGFVFPIESMPWLLQMISTVIPAKYFIISLKAIMLKGVGLIVVWREVSVLAILTFVFLLASWKNFKLRLE
ncbi:MAG: ABC transporter permease [Saprospiraceae bacterium]|nr:ABC transporter permease [Saprospiraceae bacterium]